MAKEESGSELTEYEREQAEAVNLLARDIVAISRAKGFDHPVELVDRALLLAVSEITEAQDALRSGAPIGSVWLSKGKPEGFTVEIADAIIRLLDLCGRFQLDIGGEMLRKMAYNRTRPPKHGKEF